MSKKIVKRCEWAELSNNPLMIQYHDTEWGVPVHDDRALFEFLVLEGAQAGLTWQMVLNKRENYRKAFDSFDPAKIARYGKKDIQRLLSNAGIIRNRLKIESTIKNAKHVLEIQKEQGSFDNYIWQFVNGRQVRHALESLRNLPATSKDSDAMSRDLRKKGFTFVGSTICYAFMQAVGMVNDHTTNCFRYESV